MSATSRRMDAIIQNNKRKRLTPERTNKGKILSKAGFQEAGRQLIAMAPSMPSSRHIGFYGSESWERSWFYKERFWRGLWIPSRGTSQRVSCPPIWKIAAPVQERNHLKMPSLIVRASLGHNGEDEYGHAEDCDASNGVHTDVCKDQNCNFSKPPSPFISIGSSSILPAISWWSPSAKAIDR